MEIRAPPFVVGVPETGSVIRPVNASEKTTSADAYVMITAIIGISIEIVMKMNPCVSPVPSLLWVAISPTAATNSTNVSPEYASGTVNPKGLGINPANSGPWTPPFIPRPKSIRPNAFPDNHEEHHENAAAEKCIDEPHYFASTAGQFRNKPMTDPSLGLLGTQESVFGLGH